MSESFAGITVPPGEPGGVRSMASAMVGMAAALEADSGRLRALPSGSFARIRSVLKLYSLGLLSLVACSSAATVDGLGLTVDVRDDPAVDEALAATLEELDLWFPRLARATWAWPIRSAR